MLRILFEPILELLFFGIGYFVGVFPVMLLSLGEVEPGPIERVQDFSYYHSQDMRWWHLTYTEDGRRYIPAEGVAAIGWLVVASAVGLAWLLVKLVTGTM